MYSGFLETLSKAFVHELDEIEVGYNFDFGGEFEIALCKVLRSALPQKYGVCRGFVVDGEDNLAGDDIIIYDQLLFPTFRRTENDQFAQKQKIPIEGVYAYIEAKNTLYLGVDPTDSRSMEYAVNQIGKVRKLVETRDPVSTRAISKFFSFGEAFVLTESRYPLARRNPLFTAVLSRHVRNNPDEQPMTLGAEVIKVIQDTPGRQLDEHADFIGLGPSCAAVPVLGPPFGDDKGNYIDPFMRPEGDFAFFGADDRALGAFFCSLMSALERIELGIFPWQAVLRATIDGKK